MFDPLHKWLGIPPSEQPPDDYRLLGLVKYEDDPEVIDAAADRDLAFLHDLSGSEHGEMAEQLSNRISAARLHLQNPSRKADYDAELRAQENQPHAGSAAKVLGYPPPPHTATDNQPAGAAEPPHVSPAADAGVNTATIPTAPPIIQSASEGRPTRRRRFRWRRVTFIWLGSILPASCVLGYLVFSLATGRLQLDPKKLQRIGVPSEQANRIAGQTSPSPSSVSPKVASEPFGARTGPSAGQPPESRQASTTASVDSPAQPNTSQTSASRPTTNASSRPPAIASTTSPTAIASIPSNSMDSPSRPSQPGLPAHRAPLPSPDAFAPKMDIVRELYQQTYQSAKTSEEKVAVANEMRTAAEQTRDDPEGRFALYRVAREIYVREGDLGGAIDIVQAMDRSFKELDALKRMHEVVVNVARPTTQADDYTRISLWLTEQSLGAGRVELAEHTFDTLRDRLVRIPSDQLPLLKWTKDRLESARELLDAYEVAGMSLQSDPADADAQASAGKYLAIVESRWDEAIARLAAGSDPSYRQAASAEHSHSTIAQPTALEVADLWFNVFRGTEAALERHALAVHTLPFYDAAKDSAKGLELRKIEQRLELLNQIISEAESMSGSVEPETP